MGFLQAAGSILITQPAIKRAGCGVFVFVFYVSCPLGIHSKHEH